MTALSGLLSFATCSRLALPFGATSSVHALGRRLPLGWQTPTSKSPFQSARMQAPFRADVGPDHGKVVEDDVPDLERGTKSGYTILVDYGKCDNFTQGTAEDCELKLFEALQRVDPERFPTSSSAKKTIRKGAVLVDGRPGRVDTKVTFGVQQLKIQHRTSTSFKPIGDPPFHVDILYEDDAIAVVHKPPGVLTHPMPEPGVKEVAPAMAQALTWFVSTAPDGTPGALWKPMVIHRLDKPTEGLLMAVKTKSAWQSLQQQFTTRSISKRYLAVVLLRPDAKSGTVDLPVDYKAAVSDWRVLSCFPARCTSGSLASALSATSSDSLVEPTEAPPAPRSSSGIRQGKGPEDADSTGHAAGSEGLEQGGGERGFVTTLELTPHHGRTHQLRVHCAQGLGAPIVGDTRYGSSVPPAPQGLLLAAVGLTFTHPETGKEVRVELEEPARFRSFREAVADTAAPVLFDEGEAAPGSREAAADDHPSQ